MYNIRLSLTSQRAQCHINSNTVPHIHYGYNAYKYTCMHVTAFKLYCSSPMM